MGVGGRSGSRARGMAGLGALGALEAAAEALEALAGAARARGAGFAAAPPGPGADAGVREWARGELRPALEGLLAGGLLAELEALGEPRPAGPAAAAAGAPPSDVLAVLDAFAGSDEEEDDNDVGHLGPSGRSSAPIRLAGCPRAGSCPRLSLPGRRGAR